MSYFQDLMETMTCHSMARTMERNLRHPVTLARASVCSGVIDKPFFFPPFFLAAAEREGATGEGVWSPGGCSGVCEAWHQG